jgi:acyl-CoA synthetase (NDP forming)/GNAT superfamily N-acetyltransferase
MFRIIPEGKSFSEYSLLRDGESVLLRTATAADVPAVEELMQSVSLESLQMRFMGAVSYVAPSVIQSMCSGEPRDRLCLLAIVGSEPGRVVGIGDYISLGVSRRAEVAFLVHDDFQGRGISTLILERLAGIAAAYGFVGFEAEVLYDNEAMINVFRDSGFEVHQAALNGGSLHVEFPVDGIASLRERVELRDRIAAANSLVPLLSAKTVAVVGASRDRGAIGTMIFRMILRGGFTGTAYPVNNQAGAVNGVRAYASVRDLPETPELVVISVPAPAVLDVAEESLALGAKGLLVVTSGFAESGPEGAARQRQLVEMVRSHGARLIGPNCLGLINTHPDVSLNASLAPALAAHGRVGFYSHSAALGLVILNYAEARGLGFSTFVSAGNRADVSGNDLLQYWEEDPATDLALLYLETFGNPRRFTRIARRVARRKPVLCVKSARSRAGRVVARAHIGAEPHNDTNVDVLFRQAGVIRADTLEEMFDVAVLLANQPLPRGNRVAIVSNSGGVLTICADACEVNGLVVTGSGAVDLGPLGTVEAYEEAVRQALENDAVDALIAIYACVGSCDPDVVSGGIRRGVLKAGQNTRVAKPVLLCLMGAIGAVRFTSEEALGVGSPHVFPSYRFPESAARALGRAEQYAAFRRQPGGRMLWWEDTDAAAARQEVTALLDEAAGKTQWVEGERAAKILRHFGIATCEAPTSAAQAVLEVSPDPSFGPLLSVLRDGRPPILRITPLTDSDIREIVETAGLPADCGVEELLGRISQLIEELPWLQGMTAEVHHVEKGRGAGSAVALATNVRIAFAPTGTSTRDVGASK